LGWSMKHTYDTEERKNHKLVINSNSKKIR
jgi:hypothetical protein